MKASRLGPSDSGLWRAAALSGLIVILGVVVYSRSLGNSFLWDDEVLVLNNPLIRSIRFIPDILTTPLWAGGGSYYRPLAVLSYLWDYRLWGLHPFGFHLSNLAVHLAASILLFFLLSRPFGSKAAFWASALYCVHPVHVENVASVACRCNLLEAFVLAALAAFQRCPSSSLAGGLCVVFYALGLLSKESALVFPLLAFLYGRCYFSREENRKALWVYVLLAFLAAAYVLARWNWLPFQPAHPLSVIAEEPLFWRAWTFFKSLVLYLGLLVFPLRLYTERHFAVVSFSDPWPWAGLALLLLSFGYAFRVRKKDPDYFFGLSWFLIGLGPTSNLVPLAMTMAEHWLYIPSVGLFWILAKLLQRLLKPVEPAAQRFFPGTAFALAAVVILFTGRSYVRSLDWKDGGTLYTQDLRYSKNSFLLHNNLGVVYFREGRVDDAEKEFRAAYEINPRYGTTINNLGAVLERKGDLAGAEKAYREAVARSDYDLAYANWAKLLLRTGRLPEARRVLEEARKAHPYNVEIRELREAASKD